MPVPRGVASRTEVSSFRCAAPRSRNLSSACRSDPPSCVVMLEPGTEEPATRAGRPALDPKSQGDTTMRFMVIVKADKNSEAGVLPDKKILGDMGKFNEELVKAGVMLAAEGLHPSSTGASVRFSGEKPTVTDGPFTAAKAVGGGYWLG